MLQKIDREIVEEKRLIRAKLHEQRRNHFKSLIDDNKIDLNVLRKKLNYDFDLERLEGFYNGTVLISKEGTYKRFIKTINSMIELKPTNEVITKIQIAILQRNGNLLLGKNKKRNLIELKSILNHLELDCRVIKQSDGTIIVENKKVYRKQFAEGKLI